MSIIKLQVAEVTDPRAGLRRTRSRISRHRARAAVLPPELRDVFISYARPDKVNVARPLAIALLARGYSVWFDEFELVVGDCLSSSIDRALALSRYGVVIMSPAFMERPWPQRELAGLVARETLTGNQLLLPVWHEVDRNTVARFCPLLADVVGIDTSEGTDAVADALVQAIERRRAQKVSGAGVYLQ